MDSMFVAAESSFANLVKEISDSAKLEISPKHLVELYDGEGTTHQPVIEYLDDDETIESILTAKGKSIALNEKTSGEDLGGDGKPTYVFTDSRVVGIMPKDGDDEIYSIPYKSIDSIENHFGWTKYRMEIEASDETYHLWINSSNDKDTLKHAKQYASEQSSTAGTKTSSETGRSVSSKNESNNSTSNTKRADSQSSDTPQLDKKPSIGDTFTAKIDRISGSGNGIIETTNSHINIGPVKESAIGMEITAEMRSDVFAHCLTYEAREDDYETEFEPLLERVSG